jgi:hypothetical protein
MRLDGKNLENPLFVRIQLDYNTILNSLKVYNPLSFQRARLHNESIERGKICRKTREVFLHLGYV